MNRLLAPSPPGSPFTGHLARIRGDVLGLLTESVRDHGDVVRFRVGPLITHLVNHPEHVARVMIRNRENYDKASRSSACLGLICGESLLTSNGAFWQQQRRMIQPMFHRAAVAGFISAIVDCTNTMLDSWDEKALAGEPVDAASEMMKLTFRIVGRCLFGGEIGPQAEQVESAVHTLITHTYKRWHGIINPPASWPTPANLRFRKALAEVDEIIDGLITRHRESPPPIPNLLTMLIGGRDSETGTSLDNRQIRNEAITFLLAGHETTANALSWTFHLLCRHPQWMDVIRREAQQIITGKPPAMEDFASLPRTLHVFEESLRLYPPIWAMERHVITDDEIGGYHIPRNSSVIISPYTLHRHPAFWDDPETFDPDRFLKRDHPAFIPFGAGPRHCIGSELALAEARIILPMVLRRFDLTEQPGQTIEAEPAITLRQKNGFRMRISSRS